MAYLDKTRIFSIFFAIFISNIILLNGQTIPEKPYPPMLVNDFAGIFNVEQTRFLEEKLVRFNDTTSNQITVVSVKSLDGNSPSMYATDIGLKWNVGQKDFDNGIVILIKPKLNNSDKGHAYIAVGYGLEPAIPDAIAKRVVENEMIPSFRNGNYFEGINKATDILMSLSAGEITSDEYSNHNRPDGFVSLIPFLALVIVLLIIRNSRSRTHGISSHGNGSLLTALWLGSIMGNSSRHSGSWNNFTGNRSGFGGGGFGGFGGGSFGGGGAGGSW